MVEEVFSVVKSEVIKDVVSVVTEVSEVVEDVFSVVTSESSNSKKICKINVF